MREYSTDKARADDALFSLDPSVGYDDWKNIGIAYKAAGGDMETWLAWCAQSADKYEERVARQLFKNVDAEGKITAATLFYMAQLAGWEGGRVADGALGWNDTIGDGGNGSTTPTKKAPERLNLDPPEQEKLMLETLFRSGEYVSVVTKARQDNEGKWKVADAGRCYERDELIAMLCEKRQFPGYNREAGAWICQNPTNGEGHKNDDTTAYRHALIESDELPIDEQIRIMRELDLPIATMTTSGGKSVHALVRVDADGPNHYDERVALLHEICNAAGLKADHANSNPGRLTRLAGVMRGDKRQELLFVNIGAKSFTSWLDAHRAKLAAPEDEQGPDEAFERLFETMPDEEQPEAPVLIENTVRLGQIMQIAGPPKIGKSFLVANMLIAFATGHPFLGFNVRKCERILLVNTEMPKVEYWNRVLKLAGIPSAKAALRDHVRVANTDDDPEMTIKGITKTIVESGYRPDVVIVDPIYPVFMGDENSNADARVTLAYLKKIASCTGAAVIYVHHFSKGAQDSKAPRDRASGASTLSRNYAAQWVITELAPDADDMETYPEGARVVRVDADLRSFKASDAMRNHRFQVVIAGGAFCRDEDGIFDLAPTRESARRAENQAAGQKAAGAVVAATNRARMKAEIERRFKETGGEPFPVPTARLKELFGVTPNTFRDHMAAMPEYRIIQMKVGGKGQETRHIARADWMPADGGLLDEANR